MTKHVLLTGASGFLGAHCLRWLLENTDWEFSCPVSFRHKGVPERLAWAMGVGDTDHWDRVRVVVHDLATPINPTTAALIGDVDTIINFASDTHPPRSVLHPVEFVHNNIDIALYLLEFARAYGKPTYVQISTDSVYGPANIGSHVEWDPIVPNNPYSASKAAQEALAISYWRSYRLPVVIAATMNPIGETQDLEKFIPMTIEKVLDDRVVNIHADASGNTGMRTYIDAANVASALHHILTKLPPDMHDGVHTRPSRWNIVGPEEVTNLVVAHTIANALDKDLGYETTTVDRPEHGHRYSMSGAKLSAAGWTPQGSTIDAITRIARWTADHPLWLIP